MKNYLAFWFAGGAAVLLTILAAEWLVDTTPAPSTVIPVAHHDAQAGSAATDTSDDRDTASWAEVITARPLFSIGRRPPRVALGGRPSASTGLPRLAGIIISPAGRRAIFMPDGGKPMVLAEGATVEDATIRAIHVDNVLVNSASHGMQTVYLTFDRNRPAGGTATPPPFPNPGFNPALPNPGFNGMPGPAGVPIMPQRQVIIPGADNSPANATPDDNSDDPNDAAEPQQQPQPVPNAVVPQLPFRNPASPRGRE